MTLYRLYWGGSKIRQRFRLKWLSYIIAFTHLVGLCENAEMKKVVQKLADAFRYSDPVTAAPLAERNRLCKLGKKDRQ